MYVGYVFLCTAETLKDCLRRKLFTCSGETGQTAQEVGVGSVVFLLNADSSLLVGPFTAAGSERTGLEPGAWVEDTDTHSFSANVRVEWEELHELKEALDKFPFLKGAKTCRLSHFQTRDLLDALNQAPLLAKAGTSTAQQE